MAGAPIGNRNGANAKIAKQALERALELRSPTERYRALIDIWNKQIEQALEGNNDSARMIIERLDGKPAQAIEGPDGGPIQLQQVELLIVDPAVSGSSQA